MMLDQGACFVAGTPILTPDGDRPIEAFQVGDTILSRPEHDPSAPTRTRFVEAVFELQAPVLELHVGGQRIETTAEHPFCVSGEGWVRAQQLQPGDCLVGHDDGVTVVQSIVDTGRTATVYNLRVAGDHTYFVGASGWGFSIWVHNAYIVRPASDGTGKLEIFDDVLQRVVEDGITSPDVAKRLADSFNAALLTSLRKAVRSSLPPLKKRFAKEFDGPVQIRTFKAGEKLYRSPWVPDEIPSDPGKWFGTRRTATSAGTDSMYQINKFKNPNVAMRTYELTQDVTVYYGKVKGGTGYQVLFPNDLRPGWVLKYLGETPLR